MTEAAPIPVRPSEVASVADLFRQSVQQVFRRTDKFFFILFGIQWIAGLLFAVLISPKAWAGATSSVHFHVYAAVFLGGGCCFVPMYFCWKHPGDTITRHIVAIGQTTFSSLLIHLSGGRLETHFHIFGSLAFLACYRDWRVLITATTVVAGDHLVRGIWYPMSVYGVALASPWRVAEHALWVVFEDVVLIWSCRASRREMLEICEKEHQNSLILEDLEKNVRDRTAKLEAEVIERQRSEAISRASEERYRALVENLPQIIMTIDREFKIRFINRTIDGLTHEHVIGSDFVVAYHPEEEQGRLRQKLEDVFERGETRSLEIVGPGPVGTKAWYSLTLTPLRTEGSIHSCIVLATDITEKHKAQLELIKARDLAEAGNRAKSEFLATMSHELRTPMNGVIGFTHLLLETPLAPEQKEFVETIQSSGEALLNLINDILDLSKIEAGKVELVIAPLNLREMLEEIVEVMLPRAEEKGLEMTLWHAPDVPSVLETDARRLRQAVLNLVGNAIKFTASGYVHIEVQNDPNAPAPGVRINVRDTGIGIPREKQSLLFQKFSQVDGSSTRRFGGTGLGLAICKELVEMMGGTIGVESAPGHGSNFWISHPLPAEKLKSSEADDEAVARSFQGLRVLIVDDVQINRTVLEAQLRHWNIPFESASSGPLGLEILKREAMAGVPFQIVLLDRLMPHMDGLAFAERLKSDPAIAQTAMILLTSGLHRAETPSLLKKGFARCLPKPLVRPNQLLEAISAVWKDPQRNGLPSPMPPTRGGAPELDNQLAAQSIEMASRARVLIVEDNLINQRVAALHLKKIGCSVDCVGNGREAVEIVQRVEFDCVFMDILMPEMDGYEATRRIRSIPTPSARIPIIAVTANAMQGDRERCLAAGMDDYISKPITVREIQRVLTTHIHGQKSGSGSAIVPIAGI